jgi:hypothetical protein
MSKIKERLEYLRKEIRNERISYGELVELQSLVEHIDPSDVELLEAAGVPEFEESRGNGLIGKLVKVKAKEDTIVIICQPVWNEYSEDGFFDYHFNWKTTLTLVCKVVYWDPSVELLRVEHQHNPEFSTELDMNYFEVEEIKDGK